MNFNDVDLNNWKNANIDVNSLWLIQNRDNSGKHKNIYHGNFIPQIPNQLIRRYTKENELVIDPFFGSGTTLYECEKLNRKFLGIDINEKIYEYVLNTMGNDFDNLRYSLINYDNTNENITHLIQEKLQNLNSKSAQFIIFHPPYLDIVKFTNHNNDLSNISDLKTFIKVFLKTCENTLQFLDKNRYFALVIGDVYKESEVKPLGFLLMNEIKKHFKVKLKGIIVKNIEGNRGKLGVNSIWQYRAIRSDYYIFKHEYIFVFKKEF